MPSLVSPFTPYAVSPCYTTLVVRTPGPARRVVMGETMLLELSIRDFAIIDRLRVDFGPGFNVLTGETGAGKSIIIDALGAILGERTGAEFVRAGAASARVEGIFEVDGPGAPGVRALLQEFGLSDDEGTRRPMSR